MRNSVAGSSSRLWMEILDDLEHRDRVERSWTAHLRALYPTVTVVELAERFIEPWRRVVDRRVPLEQIEGALEYTVADLPGWQSLGAAIAAAAQRVCDPVQTGRLSQDLSYIFLELVRDQQPVRASPLRLVSPAPGEGSRQGGLPESWAEIEGLVGSSPAIRSLREECARAARDRYPVLLIGETGSGKEVAACLVHRLSETRGRFVPVNCAGLPETLIECELFGHTRGAFTGATAQREGLIHAAREGTLFLDEISELPLPQQAKLLRVLQDGLVRRVGSTGYEQVDVRVIGATNRDLKQILNKGQLRRDLYYRLCVHEIRLPPLRQHREDIPELVASFLVRWRRTNPHLALPRFGLEAVELLQKAPWPGNVRQLENIVYRLASYHAGQDISAAEVEVVLGAGELQEPSSAMQDLDDINLKAMERQAVEKALSVSRGNKAGAARLLGITRKALYHKIRRYRIGLSRK